MKRILLLCALSSGCAAHQVPQRIISIDWATVEALSPGTNVALTVREDHVRLGEIKSVSAAAITLREKTGIRIVSRAEIWRVTVRDAAGTTRWPRVIQTAAIGAALTAGLAFVATMHDENGNHAGPLPLALLGAGIGAAIGATRTPQQAFHERIVYIRP